jgi:hypothetical protein
MSLQLCGLQGANTGGIKCAAAPGKINTAAIWGGELTPAEQLTLASRKAAFLADSKLSKTLSDKLFMLPLFLGKESKKEANQEQTLSNGLKFVTREGLPGWRFSFMTSFAQMVNLRKFNNTVVSIIMQDDHKRVWGSKDSDNNLIGRQAQLFFEGMDHIDDANVMGLGYVNIAFIDAIENYDDAVFVEVDFNFQTTLKALLDVQLYEKATATANVLHVSGKVDVANIAQPMDVYTEFSTTLFNTGALWTATNMQTGADITITGVASNAAGYGDLTLNSTAYNALSANDKVLITTVLPTALDTAGVLGIECTSFIHTKPA